MKRNQVKDSASRRSFDKTTYGGERKNRAFMVADEEWRPKEKHIRKAKEVMWQRWTTEDVRRLGERHDVTKQNAYHPEIGEVVLVVGDSKNRRRWNRGLICELLKGKDVI